LREARTGQELLISVVNGTAESIYVKDLELRYVLVNRAALLSGTQPRAEWQVLGRGTIDLFPPVVARRIEAADRSVLATGRMTSFEQEYQPEDGSCGSRWVAMTIAPWQDAEGRVVGVVSVSRDITASRQAESRLRAMQADLLRATRLSAMGAMASGLAHELNQPLAAATNYLNAGSRLLERGMAGDTASFPIARGAVIGGVEQLLRAGAIVRRLRDFVERGEVELQPEDIERVLRESCDLARTDGIAAGVDLRLHITNRTGLAMIDRTQIQQVLLNLIRNAAEAICSAEPGAAVGITLGMTLGEIDVSARTDDAGDLCIEVRDTGPGLPPGIAERLFQPFVSSKRTGMGIGLSICRTIIEGHGGRLTAEPREPRGMIFRITLPALHPPGESP
jgi:two-component system sensor kinase FixL